MGPIVQAMVKHPKRPRDTNQLGRLRVDTLTGHIEDREATLEERGIDPTAPLGRRGRPARAASMTRSGDARLQRKPAAKCWKDH